jgi:hypothetical protein
LRPCVLHPQCSVQSKQAGTKLTWPPPSKVAPGAAEADADEDVDTYGVGRFSFEACGIDAVSPCAPIATFDMARTAAGDTVIPTESGRNDSRSTV